MPADVKARLASFKLAMEEKTHDIIHRESRDSYIYDDKVGKVDLDAEAEHLERDDTMVEPSRPAMAISRLLLYRYTWIGAVAILVVLLWRSRSSSSTSANSLLSAAPPAFIPPAVPSPPPPPLLPPKLPPTLLPSRAPPPLIPPKYPPPASPPQSPTPASVAAVLNERFRNGGPTGLALHPWSARSSDWLEASGVLVSQFDELSDAVHPWLQQTTNTYLTPFSDRKSAMLLFDTMPRGRKPWNGDGDIPLFGQLMQQHEYILGRTMTPIGGFVLRPEALSDGVVCAYPYDPHTFNTWCDPPGLSGSSGCLPGCRMAGQTTYVQDAYPPEQLGTMLADFVSTTRQVHNARGYNEVVLLYDTWRRHLPETIEAVFYPRTPTCDGFDDCEGRTRRAHAALMAAFPDAHVPLLTLDVALWSAPFAPAPAQATNSSLRQRSPIM